MTLASAVEASVLRGEVGGRTVQIIESGEVECVTYPVAPLPDGMLRVATVRSAISSGTEMTFYGQVASNVYLHKRWNPDLRLFEPHEATLEYPLTFGYRACGEVVQSNAPDVPAGTRVYGNWRHTEFVAVPIEQARLQVLPRELSWDDGVDIGQMGPICLNAIAYAEGAHAGAPAVVFGAGPVGLITAQLARHTGAEPVYVVDRLSMRLSVAAGLGLEPVDATRDDVADTLKRRHGRDGIPVAFEATGSTAALNEAIRCVRRQGLVVALGFYQGEARGLFLGDEFHHNGIQIRSGQIGNVHRSTSWASLRATILQLLLHGDLVLGGLPRLTLPVEQVADGFKALTRPTDVLQVVLSYRPIDAHDTPTSHGERADGASPGR